jgi:CHAT domain-containing protein
VQLIAIGAPAYTGLPIVGAPAGLASLRWAPLPNAGREMHDVGALFARSERTIVTGEAATRERLLALNASGELAAARYLLVSAHAYLASQPQWSSIVLGGRGGYVTAGEIATFDLDADLVVLSACETALGRDVPGEGLYGLPFAFAMAGARRTMLTLWSVDDASASKFIPAFFAKLVRGASPADALARTKREFMRDPRYSAPFHWAPYVLVGG